MQRGLIDEVIDLRHRAAAIYGADDRTDHEEGIFQSIGYKEFSAIPTEQLTPSHPLFEPALDRMKLSTRQYAKKQLKWIRTQLLPAVKRARTLGGQVDVHVVNAGESEEAIKILDGMGY